ncbi:hypothetical protein MHYP_G00232820 [Metynnis hypsauchen]
MAFGDPFPPSAHFQSRGTSSQEPLDSVAKKGDKLSIVLLLRSLLTCSGPGVPMKSILIRAGFKTCETLRGFQSPFFQDDEPRGFPETPNVTSTVVVAVGRC